MTHTKEEIAELAKKIILSIEQSVYVNFSKHEEHGTGRKTVTEKVEKMLSEHSASLFTEEQAKDIYTVGYVDGTAYMSNAIAQAFGAEVTSEELNADKAIEKYRNELTDKGK